MKRTTVWIFALTAALLLEGCWPYWHDGHDRGRDHEDRGRDHAGQEYHRY